jgi:DNA (cytosine-5)-methyltransferase 1
MTVGMSAVRRTRAVQAMNKMLGATQERIAAELGISFSTVNAWVNGKRTPRQSTGFAIDEAFERAMSSAPGDEQGRLQQILAKLHIEYGSPDLSSHEDSLDELFFNLLSLKTSSRAYEATFEHFRSRFHPWTRLLSVGADEVESEIRKSGLGSIKAKAFIEIAGRLKNDLGEVSLSALRNWAPNEAASYLMSLPGVGIKTARSVMLYSLGFDVVPVDTHTYRVGLRLGLIHTAKNPNEAHAGFDAVTPEGFAQIVHSNLVAHGKTVCLDSTPKCGECVVSRLCRYVESRAGDAHPSKTAKVTPRQTRNHVDARTLRDGRPRAVDIYAGCGGLSLGLEMGGFDVSYALDWDKHACATHENNFPRTVVHCGNVLGVSGSDILKVAGGPVALVAGGPNCPGVSERGLRSPDDPRNFMLPEFARLVNELQPAAFLMENVPGLAHRQNFGLLKDIFERFASLGYRCGGDVLLAADYGVPQLRYRFFLIGIRDGVEPTLPAPTHSPTGGGDLFSQRFISVGDAILDLPSIPASRQDDQPLPYLCGAVSDYSDFMRQGSEQIWNHVCSATEEINLQRAATVREGGNWKDIPPHLLPDRFFACRMTDHSTTYARLRRTHPAFTITSLFGNITAGAFTHPLDNRALSIREGARLQSFPDRFRFYGPRNSQYRQIGNAVPPLLAAAVARHLIAQLNGERTTGISPRITPDLLSDPRSGDALPVLTPRFKQLFGQATKWPVGWGAEPASLSDRLTSNYMLRPAFWPKNVAHTRRTVVNDDPVNLDLASIEADQA